MPWNKVTQMDEIIRFVTLANSGRFTITDLCEQFGISRKTGYKHLERYAAGGLKALGPRSHRPHCFPQRTDAAVEALMLEERRLHRTWGPKKLHRVLQTKHGIAAPPARSTIGEILRRHGLSAKRRRKPGVYPALNDGLTEPTQPNQRQQDGVRAGSRTGGSRTGSGRCSVGFELNERNTSERAEHNERNTNERNASGLDS